MSQSPELAGGEGFTFEGDVAAFYLSALLAEAYAPGIAHRIVVRVSVQQRDYGEPLDDVIVDFEGANSNRARLSIQVKRSLVISQAKTNTDFRSIIRDSWMTLNKDGFRLNADRYGAAVGTISPAKERALKTLCDWARASSTNDHFEARFEDGGSASVELTTVKDDVNVLLEEAKSGCCTQEEVYKFLSHFVLIQFDFLREGATAPSEAINRICDCLVPSAVAQAPLVWSRIVQLARSSAGKSGQFDRTRLVYELSSIAQLSGTSSLRPDLDKLIDLAKSYITDISDDVGGVRLNRSHISESLKNKLAVARIVQVRGLAGSGKSVVVKREVQLALEKGPALFLKAERLEGTSWISYATAQGLSDTPLEQLLVEIEATGTPTLFIDAIDRVDKHHQPIIIDVIRTIVDSLLLGNWRIVVSLRDTGIEVLRNWLGDFLNALKIETVEVDKLSDEEAETLAKAKPHLRPLLFGSSQVQEIVRRPFFTKVLNQGYIADSSVPILAPQSELELIENWWQRGGYDESGQNAVERQQKLLDLASVQARNLSRPVRLRLLSSSAHISELKADGILQDARKSTAVCFAHDIFFEWAFFHVLVDHDAEWLKEIQDCGEPPAVARTVELLAQWEFAEGDAWTACLTQTENSELRSQWLRAWLVGPLQTPNFKSGESQFTEAVFSNDFRLFRKALVWFQAERTSPNTNILSSDLPTDQRQQLAYLQGWPSDFPTWKRLIHLILDNIDDIPNKFYPEIVAVFEVWQNALADISNSVSHALLEQCGSWLAAMDVANAIGEDSEDSRRWREISERGAFYKSLVELILRASKAEPDFAAGYLQRVLASEHIQDDTFRNIIAYSSVLTQSLTQLVMELSLTCLKGELPDEKVARAEQNRLSNDRWRNGVLAKPEEERTDREIMMLPLVGSCRSPTDIFTTHDWDSLSIYDVHGSFFPPSPLKEPFHSLFRYSSGSALGFFRDLCDHAVTAWKQLHHYSRRHNITPIPLELKFPWGTQRFWGTSREYLWFRATYAPKAIGCGFMALEEWCFAELDRGRSADELIQEIVRGNECIAILGIASMIALHTNTVSEVTLPIVTSQRLLYADLKRMVQDLSSNTTSLIGFGSTSADKHHASAVREANARLVRKRQLSEMVPMFVFASQPFSKTACDAIISFKDNLPFEYEEQRTDPEEQKRLMDQAVRFAEQAERDNYQAVRVEENSDQFAIVHTSPSASNPENVAEATEASNYLRQSSLWMWASESINKGVLGDTYTIENAIALAKEIDSSDLFTYSEEETRENRVDMHREAVTAAAAIALYFRAGSKQEEIEWARNVLARALQLAEEPHLIWSPDAAMPWHPLVYVAQGLASELREGTAPQGTDRKFLALIAYPLKNVSLATVNEACQFWNESPELTWAALDIAFSLCHVSRRPWDRPRAYQEALHTQSEIQAVLDAAIAAYETEGEWTALSLPAPAWIKVESGGGRPVHLLNKEFTADDVVNPSESWKESDVIWDSEQAAKVLQRIPIEDVLSSNAKEAFLDFLEGILAWTKERNAPSWLKPESWSDIDQHDYVWTDALGKAFGRVAGLLPVSGFQTRFLNPILKLDGEICWALLSPFTLAYACTYVYDAPVVPDDAITILNLCLDRLLQSPNLQSGVNQSGGFSDINQQQLANTLMFVSVEYAELAARYANGDWSEIGLILPIIDRFIRTSGWADLVMSRFLSLCERSKTSYPADVFADQVLSIIGGGADNLAGWRGTLLASRIADLVQHFAHRDAPMALAVAQKHLRILDMLVDMGDRRSAALQLSESFREVCLPSAPDERTLRGGVTYIQTNFNGSVGAVNINSKVNGPAIGAQTNIESPETNI